MNRSSFIIVLLLTVLFTNFCYANPVPITGKITNTRGEPLSGVSVIIKGRNAGATTDIAGNFSIDVKEGDVLVISFIGFKSKEITVGGQHNLSINLEEAV